MLKRRFEYKFSDTRSTELFRYYDEFVMKLIEKNNERGELLKKL